MLRRIPGTHRIRHAGRTAAAAKRTCVALEGTGYSIALLLNKAIFARLTAVGGAAAVSGG